MDVRQKGWNKKKSHIFASINAISFDNAVTFKLLSCQYIKSTAMTLVMTQLKCGPGFLKCNLFSFHFIFHWRFRKERVISLGQKPTVWQSVTIQTKHIQRRKKKISWCSVVKTCRGNYLHTHILPDIKNRACSTLFIWSENRWNLLWSTLQAVQLLFHHCGYQLCSFGTLPANGPMLLHCWRNVSMHQQRQGRRRQANMDVNNVRFKLFQQMFYDDGKAFNTLLDLKDTHSVCFRCAWM